LLARSERALVRRARADRRRRSRAGDQRIHRRLPLERDLDGADHHDRDDADDRLRQRLYPQPRGVSSAPGPPPDADAERSQMPLPEPDPDLPLSGLRVIDFSTTVAGPSAARHLADFGAQVIKVESQTHPDTLRAATPFPDRKAG